MVTAVGAGAGGNIQIPIPCCIDPCAGPRVELIVQRSEVELTVQRSEARACQMCQCTLVTPLLGLHEASFLVALVPGHVGAQWSVLPVELQK